MPKTKSGRPKMTQIELYQRDCMPLCGDYIKSPKVNTHGRSRFKLRDYVMLSMNCSNEFFNWTGKASSTRGSRSSVMREYLEDFVVTHSQDVAYMALWIKDIEHQEFPTLPAYLEKENRIGTTIKEELKSYVVNLAKVCGISMASTAYFMVMTIRKERGE